MSSLSSRPHLPVVLLAAWTGGDASAFEVLVDRHQSGLLRYAAALLGRGHPELRLDQVEFDVELPDNTFTLANLRRR